LGEPLSLLPLWADLSAFPGIDRRPRMKVPAAIGWTLGLSYRGIAAADRVFEAPIERISAWRDVMVAGVGIG
jgi:hypothetical protein